MKYYDLIVLGDFLYKNWEKSKIVFIFLRKLTMHALLETLFRKREATLTENCNKIISAFSKVLNTQVCTEIGECCMYIHTTETIYVKFQRRK